MTTTNPCRPAVESAFQLTPNMVSTITFCCRDIGYGVEAGVIEGFWTGEIDTWGKRTIRRVDGEDTLHLFTDEIVDVEAF